jgi:hypothetical protein
MFKQGLRLGFVALGFLALTACSVKSDLDSLFPITNISPGSEDCKAGYNPIALELPGGQAADLATLENTGTFSHVSTEFYYEISDAGTVKTQVHAKAVGDESADWICSNHQAGAYPSGTDLLVTMTLPTATSIATTETARYMVGASDTGLGMSSGTGGTQPAKISAVLSSMPASQYRVYALPNNRYEIHVISTETLDSKYAVRKNAIVQLQYMAVMSGPTPGSFR